MADAVVINGVEVRGDADKYRRWQRLGVFDPAIFARETIYPEDLAANTEWLRAAATVYEMAGAQDLEFLGAEEITALKQGRVPETLSEEQITQFNAWSQGWAANQSEQLRAAQSSARREADEPYNMRTVPIPMLADTLPAGATQDQVRAAQFVTDVFGEIGANLESYNFWKENGRYDHQIFRATLTEDALETNESWLRATAEVYGLYENVFTPETEAALKRGDFENSGLSREEFSMLALQLHNYAMTSNHRIARSRDSMNALLRGDIAGSGLSQEDFNTLLDGATNQYRRMAYLTPETLDAVKRGDFENSGLSQEQLRNLGEWGTSHMSWLTNNVSLGAAYVGQMATAGTDEQKLALLYMVDAYDHKKITLAGFGRGLLATVADPVNLIGGGLVVKAMGRTAVGMAAREALIASMKYGAKVGAVDGAIAGFGIDAELQSVEIGAGRQEGFDVVRSVGATAIGASAGATLGGATPAAPTVVKAGSGWLSKYVPNFLRNMFSSAASGADNVVPHAPAAATTPPDLSPTPTPEAAAVTPEGDGPGPARRHTRRGSWNQNSSRAWRGPGSRPSGTEQESIAMAVGSDIRGEIDPRTVERASNSGPVDPDDSKVIEGDFSSRQRRDGRVEPTMGDDTPEPEPTARETRDLASQRVSESSAPYVVRDSQGRKIAIGDTIDSLSSNGVKSVLTITDVIRAPDGNTMLRFTIQGRTNTYTFNADLITQSPERFVSRTAREQGREIGKPGEVLWTEKPAGTRETPRQDGSSSTAGKTESAGDEAEVNPQGARFRPDNEPVDHIDYALLHLLQKAAADQHISANSIELLTSRFGMEFIDALKGGNPRAWLDNLKANLNSLPGAPLSGQVKGFLNSPEFSRLIDDVQGRNGFIDEFAKALDAAADKDRPVPLNVEILIARYRLGNDNPLAQLARAAQNQYDEDVVRRATANSQSKQNNGQQPHNQNTNNNGGGDNGTGGGTGGRGANGGGNGGLPPAALFPLDNDAVSRVARGQGQTDSWIMSGWWRPDRLLTPRLTRDQKFTVITADINSRFGQSLSPLFHGDDAVMKTLKSIQDRMSQLGDDVQSGKITDPADIAKIQNEIQADLDNLNPTISDTLSTFDSHITNIEKKIGIEEERTKGSSEGILSAIKVYGTLTSLRVFDGGSVFRLSGPQIRSLRDYVAQMKDIRENVEKLFTQTDTALKSFDPAKPDSVKDIGILASGATNLADRLDGRPAVRPSLIASLRTNPTIDSVIEMGTYRFHEAVRYFDRSVPIYLRQNFMAEWRSGLYNPFVRRVAIRPRTDPNEERTWELIREYATHEKTADEFKSTPSKHTTLAGYVLGLYRGGNDGLAVDGLINFIFKDSFRLRGNPLPHKTREGLTDMFKEKGLDPNDEHLTFWADHSIDGLHRDLTVTGGDAGTRLINAGYDKFFWLRDWFTWREQSEIPFTGGKKRDNVFAPVGWKMNVRDPIVGFFTRNIWGLDRGTTDNVPHLFPRLRVKDDKGAVQFWPTVKRVAGAAIFPTAATIGWTGIAAVNAVSDFVEDGDLDTTISVPFSDREIQTYGLNYLNPVGPLIVSGNLLWDGAQWAGGEFLSADSATASSSATPNPSANASAPRNTGGGIDPGAPPPSGSSTTQENAAAPAALTPQFRALNQQELDRVDDLMDRQITLLESFNGRQATQDEIRQAQELEQQIAIIVQGAQTRQPNAPRP